MRVKEGKEGKVVKEDGWMDGWMDRKTYLGMVHQDFSCGIIIFGQFECHLHVGTNGG